MQSLIKALSLLLQLFMWRAETHYRRNSASILLNTSVVKHFFYYVNVSNVPKQQSPDSQT